MIQREFSLRFRFDFFFLAGLIPSMAALLATLRALHLIGFPCQKFLSLFCLPTCYKSFRL